MSNSDKRLLWIGVALFGAVMAFSAVALGQGTRQIIELSIGGSIVAGSLARIWLLPRRRKRPLS